MTGYQDFFKGKKVTLLGLGLLGRGVGDAEFLAELGAVLTVTDRKNESELAESVSRLKKYPNIIFHLGKHDKKDFTNCDMVIKAAGVPLDSPEIVAARGAGIPVYMSTTLFARFASEAGATIVGVTGTRGKSTVVHMLFHILQKAGRRVHLGGNIRGKSTLALLPEVKEGDVCVLELDSWQLQGFGDLSISPNISVFTTFMSDHLNYYGGRLETYFADKANIFLNQKPDELFVLGEQAVPALEEYGYKKKVQAHTVVAGAKNLPKQWKLQIPGEHNRYNAGLAIVVADALGVDTDAICEALTSFVGVEGRLQFVREINGVKIYNDNNATTPEATIVALVALRESRSKNKESGIILIAGGADKGLDMSRLAKEINNLCKAIILLAGTGTDSLLQTTNYKLQTVQHGPYDSLEPAVAKALELAAPDNVILFSPAFASFGMFKNEYDRNDQFLALVRELKAA